MRNFQICLIAMASCLVFCHAMPNPEPDPNVNVNIGVDVNAPDNGKGNVNVDVNVNIDDGCNCSGNMDGTSGNLIEQEYRPYCETCGIGGSGNRIVGGVEARPGKWPWQAFLLLLTPAEQQSQCGGSIIKKGWILTAAHCFFGQDISNLIISLGDHDVRNPNETESQTFFYSTFDIQDYIFLHPNYDDDTVNNDIALIELKNDLVFNKIIQPVCLGLQEDVVINKTVVVTGWGQTGDREDTSDVLLEVSLDVIDRPLCVELYQNTPVKKVITVNQICTLTPGKDACGGDSGGPLVSQLEDGRWVQIGIVSFGFQCAFNKAPGVYTKVANYFDWIELTTRSNNCSSVLPDYDYNYDYAKIKEFDD